MAGLLDTQNKAWAEDKSKFGYRMLQKMGWSEGKGLGMNENGTTEHLRARKKFTTAGIGAATGAKEAWQVPSQVANDLNEVLSRLSGTTMKSGTRKNIAPAGDGARATGTRGFFGRRIAGKSVSGYSKDALREIFGGAPDVLEAPVPNLKVEERDTCLKDDASEGSGDPLPVDGVRDANSEAIANRASVEEQEKPKKSKQERRKDRKERHERRERKARKKEKKRKDRDDSDKQRKRKERKRNRDDSDKQDDNAKRLKVCERDRKISKRSKRLKD